MDDIRLIYEEKSPAKSHKDDLTGNIYAKKGRKKGYWLVVSHIKSRCILIGFDEEGNVDSAQNYVDWALDRRDVIGNVDIHQVGFDNGGATESI